MSKAKRMAKAMAYVGLACGILYSVGGFFYDLVTTGLNGGTALAFLALRACRRFSALAASL